jgi:polyisoprenoid-binding protein YceI
VRDDGQRIRTGAEIAATLEESLVRTRSFAWLGLLTALVASACGGAATPEPAAQSATATPVSPSAAAAVGAWTVSDSSKATVRVREQLVGVSLPNDAVLVATAAKGSFQLNADGTFSADSKISFELSTLTSDERDRDGWVKQETLEVRRFPTAELVPTKTTGLQLPLPASGDFAFTLAGKMTIHGTTKDVTFDVTAKRGGGDLTATATANPTWKFGDFGMSTPSSPFRVLSVNDEIRMVVELVATGPRA